MNKKLFNAIMVMFMFIGFVHLGDIQISAKENRQVETTPRTDVTSIAYKIVGVIYAFGGALAILKYLEEGKYK